MTQKAKSKMNRKEMIQKTTENIPDIHNGAYRKQYELAVSGKSRVAGVKAFCLQCVCWNAKEVRLCTSLDCPLWPYRPYKN